MVGASSYRDRLVRIDSGRKAATRILFLAKHALSGGRPDEEDGVHAVYHHELLTTLSGIGFAVEPANSFRALDTRPDVDFVFPLLNRAGFQNSEMLGPLMLARMGIPYLGAIPIIRGLADDKHLMKVAARHHGVPTMDWAIYRREAPTPDTAPFPAERYVAKPNASSASWGVGLFDDWQDAREHVASLHAAGHDALVEAWVPLIDIAVPVVGADGMLLLPPMAYRPADPGRPRSYEEKRGLIPVEDDPLELVEEPALIGRLEAMTRLLVTELWPFDYGRFEYRYDPMTGALRFMEVNLSCNLWSKKTISRSAASVGIDHAELVETIVTHSLIRQQVLPRQRGRLAA